MPDGAPTTSAYDLGHYLRPLKRHRLLLITCAVVGLFLGLAYSVAKAPVYTSAVKVQVDATSTPNQAASVNSTNSRTNQPVNLDTEAQVVSSTAVGTIAQQLLNTATPVGALLKRVSVSIPPNSTILRIACTAHSPQTSQNCANAFGTAYLQNRTSLEKAALAAQVAATKAQLVSARGQLRTQSQVVADAIPHTPAKNYAITLQATLQTAVNQLDAQLNQFTTTVADPGHFDSHASFGITSKSKRAIPPLTGLVLGVLLGLALIFGIERYDRNVRNSDNLIGAGVGLIAEIPAPRGRASAARRRREAVARTRFDQRIASIVTGAFDADGGVVYVAQVSPGQADSDIAGHLAYTLASVGHAVEMIRPASLARAAQVPPEPAATRQAGGSPEPGAESVGWPARGGLGPEIGSSGAALGAFLQAPVEAVPDSVPTRFRRQLDDARRRARFIIIDADPAVTDGNAYILAGLSDASILVVDPERTKRQDLREVVDQISVTPSRLLGAVIWRPMRRKASREAANYTGFVDDRSSWRRHVGGSGESLNGPVGGTDPASPLPPRPVDASR